MRILALSDIVWSARQAGADLQELIALIDYVDPELVLLAGDLVDNDKRVNHARCLPYWRDLGVLLDVLESRQLPCCFVQGNWDEEPEYEALAAHDYIYVHEVSDRVVNVSGLRIFGIPHAVTAKRRTMREITTRPMDPIDIVLTHADGVRRMRLFELPTRLIITGHYDQKVSLVRDKLLIAFENYPGEYAVIEVQPAEIGITYLYGRLGHEIARYDARLKGDHLEWLNGQPPEAWGRYAQHMEALVALKDQLPQLELPKKREAIRSLLEQGVYKAHILEYIPGAAALLSD